MKIISSYGVELRKQNIPIRQTLEIYRSAVRYLVEGPNRTDRLKSFRKVEKRGLLLLLSPESDWE